MGRAAFTALFIIVCIILSPTVAQQNCPYSESGLQSFNTVFGTLTSSSDIIISSKVILDVSNVVAQNINITNGGQLIFRDAATSLSARVIFVGDGGALRIGSSTCPLKANIVITLTGPHSTASDMKDEQDGILMGTKGIGVSSGGSIDVHGVSPQPTWTRLSKHASKNSTTISLQRAVDWKINSTIVIASTDYPGVYLGGNSTTDPAILSAFGPNHWSPQPLPPDQNEQRIIIAISSDRRTLTLDSPLNFTHYGLDMSAEVGLLTRNIKIQGDEQSETSFFGGHILVRNVVAARFTGVELYHMGQKGVVGRYPIHFHLMGNTIDPANRYIKDSSVHDLYQRCVVIHTSHGVMHTIHKAIDGPETYNAFDGNLGILANPIYASDPDGVSRRIIVADAAPSIFWIVNANNTVINNVAVEAQNGFWFALPDAPVGISFNCCSGVVPRTIPLLSFKNNVAHSTGSGLFVDKGIVHSTPAGMVASKTTYAPSSPAIFDGFIAYKNRDFGIWTSSDNVHVINAALYDNKLSARMIAGRNSLQNAIVQIDTDNYGVPASGLIRSRPLRYNSELTGWMFYDHGSQSLRNVTFIGFNSTRERTANAINFPCQPHPHNSFMKLENIKYVDSIVFRIPNITSCYNSNYDNLKSVNVMDTDGSTTGWVGGWIISNEAIHKSPGCINVPEWTETTKCPPTYEGYVRTQINVPLINVPPLTGTPPDKMQFIALEQEGVDVLTLRGDSTMNSEREVTGYNFAANLKNTRSYFVRWLSDSVSTRVNLRMGEYGQPGEWVILILPYPKYTSVDALNDLVMNTYYYDSVRELLYVRLSIAEENNNGGPRGTWANWAHYNTGSGVTLTVLANCSTQGLEFCPAPDSNNINYNIKNVPLPLRREQLFRADLSTCGDAKLVPYRDDIYLSGTAFFSYDPTTARLSYHILHNIGQTVTKMLVQYQESVGGPASVELELPAIPVAPVKGFTYLTRESHQRLISGKLRIVFATDSSPNGLLFGYFGCVDNDCTLPEKLVNVSSCSEAAVNSTVDIFVNGNFTRLQQAWAGSGSAYVIAPSNDSVSGVCGSKPIKAFVANGYVNIGTNSAIPDLDVPKFKFIEFYIKSIIPPTGQPDLYIAFRNSAQIGNRVRIGKSHILDHAISEQWTRVRIPLSEFNITTSIAFRYLQFTQVSPSGARPIFYFDQIRFTSVADPAPVIEPESPKTVVPYTANQCAVSGPNPTNGPTTGDDGQPTTSTSGNDDVDNSSKVVGVAWLMAATLMAYVLF